MHSYKFIATLQEKNKGDLPILLLTENNYGHHGGDETADAAMYAFIYEQLGVKPVSVPD
jgi:prolyl oligopeptidase